MQPRTATPEWNTMQSFLMRGRKANTFHRRASSTTNAITSNISARSGQPDHESKAKALKMFQEALQNDTLDDQIAGGKRARDELHNGYGFTPENGFYITADIPLLQPIVTASGAVVPTNHLALKFTMTFPSNTHEKTLHTIHLYSHSYENLSVNDLTKGLQEIVKNPDVKSQMPQPPRVFGMILQCPKITFFHIQEVRGSGRRLVPLQDVIPGSQDMAKKTNKGRHHHE
jgi:hypothetical protein